MDVKLIKLVTGEEIVAEIISSDDTSVTVGKAVAAVLQPGRDGSLSVGFIPWGTLSKKNKTISMSQVVYITTPEDDVASQFSSMFSGIVTPPKTLITG